MEEEMNLSDDRIERVVELPASASRVWRALTDHQEFGEWFRVRLDGPFEVGEVSTGEIIYPGYEGLPWRAVVDEMEPERLFSFRWHDYDENSELEVADQPTTRVQFLLERIEQGVRLTIRESGFSAIPYPRRLEAIRNNREGWRIQADNLRVFLTASD